MRTAKGERVGPTPRLRRRGRWARLATAAAVMPVLAAPGALAAPANDGFADAAAIALSSPDFRDTTGAGVEPGEPQPRCGVFSISSGATVWYRFTAIDDALLAVSTFGSDFDTVVGVYVGETLGGLEQVACSDDTGARLESIAGFVARAGQTYHIQVGGYGGAAGAATVRLMYGAAVDAGLANAGIAADPGRVQAGARADGIFASLGASTDLNLTRGRAEVDFCANLVVEAVCYVTYIPSPP